MKRWHLTLLLALLAAGGVALALTLPAVGVGLVADRLRAPPEVVIAEAFSEPALVTEPVAPAPAPAPPLAPVRPSRPVVHQVVHDGVHPIHVDQGERGGLIPELSEPVRRPPVIVELPPDPPSVPDGCPACGMG